MSDAQALARAFDPFNDPYLSDPYPFFVEARQAAPVFYSEALDYWIVSRYEDVREVLSNWRLFSASNTLDTLNRFARMRARRWPRAASAR